MSTEAIEQDRTILQLWVTQLGIRHQGTLISAVRGCDTAPKNDVSKALARAYRAAVLNPFCGDPAKATTFIELVGRGELATRMVAFRINCDHYPQHYVAHLMHAAEIVGFKRPNPAVREDWSAFYYTLCNGLHVTPETEAQMDARLLADEEAFGLVDRL